MGLSVFLTRRSAVAGLLAAMLAPSPGLAKPHNHCVRIGRRILTERGVAAASALVRAQGPRLKRAARGEIALSALSAEDHRAGRVWIVGGVRLSRVEAALCVAAALDAGEWNVA